MLFWCVLIAFTKKHRTILLLVIPHSLYAIFGASVYFYQHHIGITTLFLLFWVWVSEEQKTDGFISLPNRLKKLIEIDSPGHIKLSNLFFAIYVFVVVISASWSVVASFNEIRTAYGYGRGAAALIKEYGLEDLNIIIGWQEKQDSKTGKTVYDTNNTALGVTLLPYFDNNIISNLNDGGDSLAYATHKVADDETNLENLENWISRGIPDVLIGCVDLDALYGNMVTLSDYAPVYEMEQTSLWKTNIPCKSKIF